MANSFRKAGSPFKGGDTTWLRSNLAGTITNTEFFGVSTPPTTVFGYIKYWTGAAWGVKPVKYWNGTSWIQKPLKYWNGSAWTLTSYSV
jgi:hypothetical protein